MSEFVKLEDVKNAFNRLYGNEYSFAELREKLNVYDEDSADAKPVAHGTWTDEMISKGALVCSVCFNMAGWYYDFCPHCGADMRGDNEHKS